MSVTLLVTPKEWEATELWISDEAFHHLFRVRRLRRGDRVRLVDGCGRAVWSTVQTVEKARALLEPGEPALANEAPWELELAVAALRPERASWLVEKGTELGVSAIRFFNCERAPRSYGEGTLERFRRLAGGAVEQSQRSRLPEVSGIHDLQTVLGWTGTGTRSLVLDRESPRSLAAVDPGAALVIVGPEGGLSCEERRSFAARGAQAVSLGSSVLRVETAALAAAALLLLRNLGD